MSSPHARRPFSAPGTAATSTSSAPRLATGEATHRLVLWLIFGFGIAHLVYASMVGLAGDEAYYWQWSRWPAWGYYDHPPMVAALIAIGTGIAGDNEFGLRVMTVVLATAVLWLVYRMAVQYSSRVLPADGSTPAPESAGLWTVLVLVASPLFGGGNFIATPDMPMVFFWALSIQFAFSAGADPRPQRWVLLGLALGLGVLSKYSMAILPLALIIAFAATRRGRELLRTPGPYLAAAVGVLVLVPHLVWLAHHDFVSVSFQLGHGLGNSSRSTAEHLASLGNFVAGQVAVLTPGLFLLFAFSLWRGAGLLRRRVPEVVDDTNLTVWVMVMPAVLTFLVFGLASLVTKSQANWPSAGYVTLSIVLGTILARCVTTQRANKIIILGAVGLAALLTLYAHVEIAHPLVPYGRSAFDKLRDRSDVARWLQGLRTTYAPGDAAVYADNYRLASLLAFYLPDHPATDAPFEAGSGAQYTLWRQTQPVARDAWYVTTSSDDGSARRLFSDYRLIGTHVETRAGRLSDTVRAYYGRLRSHPVDNL